MATKSKAYKAAAEKIEADRFYTPSEAVAVSYTHLRAHET